MNTGNNNYYRNGKGKGRRTGQYQQQQYNNQNVSDQYYYQQPPQYNPYQQYSPQQHYNNYEQTPINGRGRGYGWNQSDYYARNVQYNQRHYNNNNKNNKIKPSKHNKSKNRKNSKSIISTFDIKQILEKQPKTINVKYDLLTYYHTDP
eukprot:145148_1